MRGFLESCLDVVAHEERESVDPENAYARTGRDRNIRLVAHRPEGAAVLGLAAFPRGEPDLQRQSALRRVRWERTARDRVAGHKCGCEM